MNREGKLAFKCQHNSCSEIGWKKFRAEIEKQKGEPFCYGMSEKTPHSLPNLGEQIGEKCVDETDEIDERPGVLVGSVWCDMTAEEVAEQEGAEYPVYKLFSKPGPDLAPSLLYGILGHAAKRMCEYSEAHRASVYLNLIISIGNMMGRHAYFIVDNTRQYTNDFLAIVGPTAEGRKGLAADVAAGLLALLDSEWFNHRNFSGFSTQQGIISYIKDETSFDKLDPKTRTYKTITQPGVADKRLCIREGELSNVFKLISDSNQRAGEVFRNLWDGKPVSNLVAGKSAEGEHNSVLCKEPMGSIIGCSTPSLVKATLPTGADSSGDGNRIIWCYTKRTQFCPFGGPQIDWASEIYVDDEGVEHNFLELLIEAVAKARYVGLMPIARKARSHWQSLYLRLEGHKRAGFLGGMTTRGSPHVRRLAMILALLDQKTEIHSEHLEAAEAIWDFSVESARYIFTSMTLDGAKIVRAAEAGGAVGVTATDIHNLFHRHKSASWVKSELNDLTSRGFIVPTKETRPHANGGAHEVDVYRFKKW